MKPCFIPLLVSAALICGCQKKLSPTAAVADLKTRIATDHLFLGPIDRLDFYASEPFRVTKEYVEVSVNEIHRGDDGADPHTHPTIGRFRVDRRTGEWEAERLGGEGWISYETYSIEQIASTVQWELVEIRGLYNVLVEAQKSGVLHKQTWTREPAEPCGDCKRVLYTDSNGVARIYHTDDPMVQKDLYYDYRGRLRFVSATVGAANGTRIEHRIHFSQDGRRIQEEQTRLEGPGYDFPKVWPDEALPRDPKLAFRKKD